MTQLFNFQWLARADAGLLFLLFMRGPYRRLFINQSLFEQRLRAYRMIDGRRPSAGTGRLDEGANQRAEDKPHVAGFRPGNRREHYPAGSRKGFRKVRTIRRVKPQRGPGRRLKLAVLTRRLKRQSRTTRLSSASPTLASGKCMSTIGFVGLHGFADRPPEYKSPGQKGTGAEVNMAT